MKHKITFLPDNKIVEIQPGTDILTAVSQAGIDIVSSCGGNSTCGRCKVIIKSGKVDTQPSVWISADEKAKGYALACQTVPLSDLVIEIPPESQIVKLQAVGEEIFTPAEEIEKSPIRPEETIFTRSPLVKKAYLEIPTPSLEDNTSDWERVVRYLNENAKVKTTPQITLPLIRRLSRFIRQSDWKFTITLGESDGCSEVIQFEPGDTMKQSYGIALDIGTTTVVTYLVDLNSGEILGAKASHNRQMSFGDDVITRMMYAENEQGLEELTRAVQDTVNDLIVALSAEKKVSTHDILAMQVAGNTTMIHLFLRVPPGYIRREPYVPTINFPITVHAGEIGLKINPRAVVAFLPGVSSYIGGDITAGVLACGMDNFATVSLLIDLGTNGELVLGNRDWLISCACSAGPAFEGVGIKCGIRAMEGAIQDIEVSDDNETIKYTAIGATRPKGICGSGLVDIPAEFLQRGIINRAGKFVNGSSSRIRQGDDGKELVLVSASESVTNKDIIITENDITNLIRSKGAVFLGIDVLLQEVGLKFDNIGHIYIAGGFGTYLDIEKAILIGLLPDVPRDKFTVVGNSSVTGAKMCLLSREARDKATKIAQKMTYIELSVNPKFMNEYTSTLFLPHTNLDLFPSVKKILK